MPATVMRHQHGSSRARTFSPAARTWAYSRPSAIPRTWAVSTAWTNMRATAGRRTAAIRRTPPAGGAARIRSALLDYSVVHNGEISLLRRQPPLHRNVRLQVHASDRYRGHHIHCSTTCYAQAAARRWRKRPTVIAAPFWSTIRGKAATESRDGSPICARCFPVF